MIMLVKMLLATVCAGITLAQQSDDPLCVLKNCPDNIACRVVTECSSPGSCTLRAECMDNPPKWSHTGVCQIGQPILVMRDGSWGDTHCGDTLPCPNSTYCNTDLMDTYATCCRSDPTNTIKPGECPSNTDSDRFYCTDGCNNDGDCRNQYKCCQTGCRRQCLPPQDVNSCLTKKCPEGSYCLTSDMPPCTSPGICYKVGECISCGHICTLLCHYGNEKDSRGCPICKCKPPPNTINPGRCPNYIKSDSSNCIDDCNNDEDCRNQDKCCQTGCRRQCLYIRDIKSCLTEKCPEYSYCLTSDMPPCTSRGFCYKVGECIPCGPICRMGCYYGFEKDSLGCPICKCKLPPKTINPGRCPSYTTRDSSYCTDDCNDDGDCRNQYKCCLNGCSRRCLRPRNVSSCRTKKCPEGSDCYMSKRVRCTSPGICYKVGAICGSNNDEIRFK